MTAGSSTSRRRAATTTTPPRRWRSSHRSHPTVGADIAALAHHALAEVFEWARIGRLTRNQHVLFRLGELAALTEGAAALARRAARAADGTLAEKTANRFSPEALAAMARVFAREAALKTATDGVRWVRGGGGGERRGPRPAGGGGRHGGGAPSSGRIVGRSRRGGRRAVRPPEHWSAVHEHRAHHRRRRRRRRRDPPRRPGCGDASGPTCAAAATRSPTWIPERWDPAFYYDANPKAPDKTYSKIGGWVRDWTWDPLGWKLPIPPRVGDAMDDAQKWAVACTRAALLDYGWPERSVDGERTAVVLGNAMSGEHHYLTALRIAYPELAHELDNAPTFQALPADVRKAISAEFGELLGRRYPEITEDTMPGELGNCMAGRVANLFDLHGPNFVVDAACASALAAIDASVAGLVDHSLRHRHRRWRRPQHGRVELRQVLQDRRPLGHRHPAVRRRRRRLRDG